VLALVEVDSQQREIELLTNNLCWSVGSVADVYRCRSQIEVFFKQIKQLAIPRFPGQQRKRGPLASLDGAVPQKLASVKEHKSYSQALRDDSAKNLGKKIKTVIDFDLYSSRLTAINHDHTEVTGNMVCSSVLPCYS
jgi:hypothetical protein